MRIVLSPGHHDQAQGATNWQYKLTEHGVALKIVDLVEEILHQAGHTIYIANGTLPEKIAQVNELHARAPVDIAMDLHFNADADHTDPDDWDNDRGDGCMVLHNPGKEKRKDQATLISSVLAGQLGEENKGARDGWYWGGRRPGTKPDAFVRRTHCPAFIPEPGYIDNMGFCERHLLGERWEGVAGSLATAIMAYGEAY